MVSRDEALRILETAELVCPADEVQAAVVRLGREISESIGDTFPVVLQVMRGSSVFCGHLLPLLHFPLEFDYIHATRYENATAGREISWKVNPPESVRGRTVLVVDDILDEGHTLAAIRESLLARGAAAVRIAVFCVKDLGREKPVSADFVGVTVPDRYVFGYGMDAYGAWRNLPAVYALKEQQDS
ncbi:MAG: hypoxanthine-guanine phosphoribosyltransferase [Betaproteobacteria bacterium]|nr:hypoxanthine-guanine phosphoribosyltransferase [Betaproteobacteria bacterium]